MDAVAEASDVDSVVRSDEDSDGTGGDTAEFVRAETSGIIAFVSPCAEGLAVRIELLNASEITFGGIDTTEGIAGDVVGSVETGAGFFESAELTGFRAVFPPLGEEFSLRVEFLDAVIALVGDQEIAIGEEEDSSGLLKLPRFGALFAPFAEGHAVIPIDDDFVLHHERAVEFAAIVDGHSANEGLFSDGIIEREVEAAEVPALGVELLDAGVIEIGDEDFVAVIDRDLYGRMELSGLIAGSSPFEDEFNRGWFVGGESWGSRQEENDREKRSDAQRGESEALTTVMHTRPLWW